MKLATYEKPLTKSFIIESHFDNEGLDFSVLVESSFELLFPLHFSKEQILSNTGSQI